MVNKKKTVGDILQDIIGDALNVAKQTPQAPQESAQTALPYTAQVYEQRTIGGVVYVLAHSDGWHVARKENKRWVSVYQGQSLDDCREWAKGLES